MTVIKHVGSLTKGAVSLGYAAARHPLSTTLNALGLAKGAAEIGVGLVRGATRDHGPVVPDAPAAPVPTQRTAPEAAPEAPSERADGLHIPTPDEVAVRAAGPAPGQPGEAFHTEPKAASRASAHGGGPTDQAEIDGYLAEVEDDQLELDAAWTSETPVGEDGVPLISEGEAKAVASESEMMRRGAERDPE